MYDDFEMDYDHSFECDDWGQDDYNVWEEDQIAADMAAGEMDWDGNEDAGYEEALFGAD